MANVSISVKDETKKRMNSYKYINWSEVGRRSFEEKLDELEMLEKIVSKSKLTEEDAIEIGRKINKAAYLKLEEAIKSGKK